METSQGEQIPRTIANEDISKLVGKVLTIFDAAYGVSTGTIYTTSTSGSNIMAYSAPSKEEAIKNLITQAIWEWYQSR